MDNPVHPTDWRIKMNRETIIKLLEWMFQNQYAELDKIVGIGGLDVCDMETIVDGFIESLEN